MKSKKGLSIIAIMIVLIICTSFTSLAHPGRTDSSGGHKDNKNVSGLGSYHYHCGGHPAHLHKNGVCPYASTTSNDQPSPSPTVSSSTTIVQKDENIIGEAVYTDIAAYINHYPIQSYNVNGNTLVVAEDLLNYGFNVVWNADSRSLYITNNTNATAITPYGTVYKASKNKIGKKAHDVLKTDIAVYINYQLTESYNINGKTIVVFDNLNSCGEVVWVPDIRAIKLWMNGLPMTDYKALLVN